MTPLRQNEHALSIVHAPLSVLAHGRCLLPFIACDRFHVRIPFGVGLSISEAIIAVNIQETHIRKNGVSR
jgi:hypothetical protein